MMTKKLRRELEVAKRALDASLAILSKDCLGFAKEIPADRTLGSDYDLRNPNCKDSCFGAVDHARIFRVEGSELVRAFTAQAILTRLLSEDQK